MVGTKLIIEIIEGAIYIITNESRILFDIDK